MSDKPDVKEPEVTDQALKDAKTDQHQPETGGESAAPIKETPKPTKETPKPTVNLEKAADDKKPDAESENRHTESSETSGDKGGADTTPPPAESPDGAVVTGLTGSIFNACAKAGPLALLLAVAILVWPHFLKPDQALFCPGEMPAVTTFLHCVAQHSWLAPTGLAGGSWVLPQWPVFYWFTGLLAAIPGVAGSGYVLPLTSALSAALAVLAVWGLAFAAGFGARAAFAAGCILICAPLFAPFPHFVGSAPLGAALMVFALLCFCRGWRGSHSWISLPAAFVLTALAGLCGGIFHFAIPLVASLCYLIWRVNLRRAQSLDALAGFVLLLAIVGSWLGTLMLGTDNEGYLPALFAENFDFSWPLAPFWWLALAVAALGSLPWLLMIFGVSWVRILTNAGKTLGASRRDNGSALIWISLVLACGLAVFTTPMHAAAMALVCLAAPLLGKAFVNLSPAGNRFFFLLVALFLIIAGVAVLAASFPFSQHWLLAILPVTPPEVLPRTALSIKLLPLMGAILVVGGLVALCYVWKYRQQGGVIYGLFLVMILTLSALLLIAPELGNIAGTRLEPLSRIEKSVEAVLAAPRGGPIPAPAQTPVPAPSHAAPGAPLDTPAQSLPLRTPPASPDNTPTLTPTPEAGKPQPDATPAPPAESLPQAPEAKPDAVQPEAPAAVPNPEQISPDQPEREHVRKEMIIIEDKTLVPDGAREETSGRTSQ